MKKFISMAAIAMVAMIMASCSSDDPVPTYVVTFEEDYFSQLIDNPQYGGKLIYSNDPYKWQDKETTLSSTCEKADWTEWGMGYGWDYGVAISNYVDATATSFDKQLSVPVSNGSKNFAVVWSDNSELSFADGKAHTFVSMDVCNTSYVLDNIKKNLGTGYFFKVKTKLYKADNTVISDEFLLAKDEQVLDKWTRLYFPNVGPIKKIVFEFDGSDKGEWGLNTPKYFAIDNIVVEL